MGTSGSVDASSFFSSMGIVFLIFAFKPTLSLAAGVSRGGGQNNSLWTLSEWVFWQGCKDLAWTIEVHFRSVVRYACIGVCCFSVITTQVAAPAFFFFFFPGDTRERRGLLSLCKQVAVAVIMWDAGEPSQGPGPSIDLRLKSL